MDRWKPTLYDRNRRHLTAAAGLTRSTRGEKMTAKAIAMKDLKRCEECDMYGIPDRFEDAKICVSCRRHEVLRQRVCTLEQKIEQLLNDSVIKETQEKKRFEEDKDIIQKFEERLNSNGIGEEIGNKLEIYEKWTTIVKRRVEKE